MLRVMRIESADHEHDRPATSGQRRSSLTMDHVEAKRRKLDATFHEPPDFLDKAKEQLEKRKKREKGAIQAYAQRQARAYLQAERVHELANAQRRQLYLGLDADNPMAASTPRRIPVKDLINGESGENPSRRGTSPEGDTVTPSRNLSYSMETSPETAADSKPYRCEIPGCERKFKKLNGLIAHHQAAHTLGDTDDPKPFKCNVADCDNAYKNSNGLAYHLENAHGGGAGGGGGATRARSRTPSAQTTPQPKEGVEKPWNCPYRGCDKTYKNLKGLAYHLQKGKATGHMVLTEKLGGMNVYVCAIPTCGKTYKTPQSLVEHVESSHADMEPVIVPTAEEPVICKIVECPSCMRPFKSAKGLAEHIALIHHVKASPPVSPDMPRLSADVFALQRAQPDIEYPHAILMHAMDTRHPVTGSIEGLLP